MAAISPQLPARSVDLVEQRKLGFPILFDRGNELASRFGLRWTLPEDLRALYSSFGIDLAAANGDDTWTLPMPARYVIAPSGVIGQARVHPDYTRRPEPEETIEFLRSSAT